jgi:hypothetical protein
MQLLRHSLNVVQTVNTNDELDALELLFQPRNALLDNLFRRTSLNLSGLMPIGKALEVTILP